MYEVTQPPLLSKILHPDSAGRTSSRYSRMWLPKLSLSDCVFTVFSRDIRGVSLSDTDRYSYFPSVPACTLVWQFEGEFELLEPGEQALSHGKRVQLPARFTFTGPFNQPRVTWTQGGAYAFVLMLMPDAFHAMTGIEPAQYVNRNVPAADLLDDAWMAMSQEVFEADNDVQRVALIERFLVPLWANKRPQEPLHRQLIKDWSQGLATRAATLGFGRSLRQVERRVKQWTGQPLRDLNSIARLELVLFDVLAALERNDLSWAEVAADCGFSDQAHLCRQSRKLTGFSPDDMRRRIFHDESLWFYRLWSGIRQVPE